MRRRILLLSVGMTTLVVLAFAVPLIILLRSSTANEAKDQARYRAEAAAYYVGDANHTADDITAYIDGLTNNGPGTISVRSSTKWMRSWTMRSRTEAQADAVR